MVRRPERPPELDGQETPWAAEALNRQGGDAGLRDDLAAAGFQGKLWWLFTHELARYGHLVVTAWLHTKEMFAQCGRRGCRLGDPPLRWCDDDLRALTNDTVGQAVLDFRDRALIGGGWQPDGGASLKTYFVGCCVLAFPNVYRRWQKEQAWRQQLTGETEVLDGVRLDHRDPADLAVRRLRLWEGFDAIPDDRTKRAVLLQEAGHRVDEIAELLGETSRDVVRGLLQRQRRRWRGGSR